MQPIPAAVNESVADLVSSVVADHVDRRLQNRNYVILLTTGREDGGKRATLAFSAACSARAMDLKTHVFLVGDGSYWAYEGSSDGIHQQGFPALADLVESFVELGGQVFVCSACDTACAVPPLDSGTSRRRLRNVEPRGLATVLSFLVEGASVTF